VQALPLTEIDLAQTRSGLGFESCRRLDRLRRLEGALQVLRREAELATNESERLLKSIGVSEASRVEAEAHVRAAYAEIERLQGLLNMIYRSRTWKLHAMMERMRGRG